MSLRTIAAARQKEMKERRTVVATTTRMPAFALSRAGAASSAVSDAGEDDTMSLARQPPRDALGRRRPPPPLLSTHHDMRARTEHPAEHVVEPAADAQPHERVDAFLLCECAVPIGDRPRFSGVAARSEKGDDVRHEQEHAH